MSKTLSQHLKDIGDETVEIVLDGGRVQVTRTEALARRLFLMAMGGVEEIVVDGEIEERTYKPDHKVAKSIREYTEGKAAPEPPKKTKPKAKAGQYNSEIGIRLNERLGGGDKPGPVEPLVKPKSLVGRGHKIKGKW